MSMNILSDRRIVAAMGCVVLTARLAAQEGAPALEFSFSNPGARSMGFGGAFVALADDATATFANPAGLVQLTRPEVSMEGRFWSYSTEFVAGGRAGDAPTGIGIDTIPGLRRDISSNDLSGVSFLSIVYPVHNWSVAFYRHQLANFEADTRIEGLFRGIPELGPPARDDMETVANLEIVSHGLAASYRASKRLSLGFGVSFLETEFTSRTDDFRSSDIFGPGDFRPENIDDVALSEANDTGFSFLFGILWRPAKQWTIGGVFREGPKVDLQGSLIAGPVNDEGVAPGEVLATEPSVTELPDVIGLGTAYRSRGGAWTVSFEWDQVKYSSIFESSGGFGGTQIDDVDELHLGFEYALIRRTPVIALRFGVWHDPDHGIRATPEAGVFTRAVFQGGTDEIHFAGGLGVAFKTLQIDIGVDLSDRVDTAAISAIYTF